MATKVVVNSSSQQRVSINNQQGKTVKTIGIGGSGGSRTLAGLQDVDASDADNNELLVYDETQDKFVVKAVPVVDGGNF